MRLTAPNLRVFFAVAMLYVLQVDERGKYSSRRAFVKADSSLESRVLGRD